MSIDEHLMGRSFALDFLVIFSGKGAMKWAIAWDWR
jgi:hypothetical protein